MTEDIIDEIFGKLAEELKEAEIKKGEKVSVSQT